MHPLDTASFAARLTAGLIAAGISWAAAVDVGQALLRRLAPQLEDFQTAVFGAALGYALLGTCSAALALLHLLTPWSVISIPVVAILLRFRHHSARVAALPATLQRWWRLFSTLSVAEKALSVSAGVAVCLSIAAAALPAVWWDPLAYHLPIVALALRHGTLIFDPGLPQTGFPLLAEAAALPAYAFAGSAGAAMVTLGCGIALALLCAIVADSLVPRSGLLAATLMVTSALWLWLAPSFYVDIPFAMFTVAALTVPYLRSAGADVRSLGLLCGALAGAAAATKYPGLVIAALAFASLIYVRKGSGAVPFVAGFLLMGLAWYARSWVLTGDPLYPFVTAILSHHASGSGAVNGQMVQRFYAAAPRYCGTSVSGLNALLLPWRLLTEPLQFCGDPGFALRLASVLFIGAAVLVKAARPFVLLVIALTAFWFVSAQQWRFLVAALTLFTAVSAVAVFALQPRIRATLLAVFFALSLVGSAADVLPSLEKLASNSLTPAWTYMRGAQTGGVYLRHRLESYAAAQWIAQRDSSAKIFALNDVRDYYFGTNVAWGNSPYPGGLRIDWSAASKDRYAWLRHMGFRYMVVNANPAYTHRTATSTDWGALARDERSGLLHKVFSENDVAIYDLQALKPLR